MAQLGDRTTRPRWLFPLLGCGIVGLCVVVAVGAVGAYFLLGLGPSTGNYSGDFDAERWRQATMGCDPDNPRLGMYRSLEQKLLAERPTRTEVLALLGDDGGSPTSDVVIYQLGYNVIDCDSLEIAFSDDGRVSTVRYIQG